jgi:hypothetical protein
MTEKSNELSDKDKVTQASDLSEIKGIENQDIPNSNENIPSETTPLEVSENKESTIESDTNLLEDNSEIEPRVEEISSELDKPTENLSSEVTTDHIEVESKVEEKSLHVGVSETKEDSEAKVDSAANFTNEVKDKDVSENDDSDDADQEEEEHHEDEVDFGTLSKIELIALLKSKVAGSNIFKTDKVVHEIKAAFDEFTNKEKEEALENFKAEGGVEDDFDFRPSDEEREFNSHYYEFKKQLGNLRKEAEKKKESNFNAKTELLNRLRDLVDGEETTLSIKTIKDIQETWKVIGQVPAAQNRSLWASYNALMDRFYDNRSIYFELKELDRKKNLESKNELVDKAESLKNIKDLKDAIKGLNDLHEEFKHIGPVPRDEQEALWLRFKGASDAVYDRRKDFYEGQKEVFKKNQDEKELLIEKLKVFGEFKADRIRDWNIKTKDILEVQKSWEKIGPVTRESGKEINKSFWALFKQFFHNKNLFFKELDEIRATNQGKAENLITKATELSESTDWQNTANALVKLQQEWKKLGPTPEKNRDSLYKRFKKACDNFFDSRRTANTQSNAEFDDNLNNKRAVCQKIIELATDSPTEESLTGLITEFNEIGFVPRKNIKEVQAEFKTAVDIYLEKLGSVGSSREDFLFRLNLNRIQSDPNATQTLNKKEHGIRKQISELENNITLWQNNLEFFASSKTADKLKDQFDLKIQKAEEEVDKLKKKLTILKEF